MSFVFTRVIRDAEKVFHSFQESRLKRLTLTSGKYDWIIVKRDGRRT